MTLKRYFEMDASHQVAFRLGQAFERKSCPDLTSKGTVEKVRRVLTDDFALHLDLSDSALDAISKAVLRAVKGDTE